MGEWRLMRLQGIAGFLVAAGSILLAAAAVALSAGFLAKLARFERVRRRQARPRSHFLRKLVRGLAKQRIQTIGDVHNCYRSFFGVDVLRGSHLEEVAEFLEGAMRRGVSTPQRIPQGGPQRRPQSLRELLAANQRALDVELMCVPFSGTPEPERRILEKLLEIPVEDNNTATVTLNALARAIRIRQDTVERMSQESGRSLRWARWGWYGTLTFAILSAVLGIMYLGW
jgi:hypothetical protein